VGGLKGRPLTLALSRGGEREEWEGSKGRPLTLALSRGGEREEWEGSKGRPLTPALSRGGEREENVKRGSKMNRLMNVGPRYGEDPMGQSKSLLGVVTGCERSGIDSVFRLSRCGGCGNIAGC